jgi:tetratricopeptide (TPR) repeat protein
MRTSRIAAGLVLTTVLWAQSPPASCPADRPVDEVIAELKRQQSKNASRNKNPIPDAVCFAGWCRQSAKTPPTIPQPGATAETPRSGDVSSSKVPVDKCDEAMEKVLQAAHDIEVGDFYFEDKSYKPALLRYEDALKSKPHDAAIHVRLGRVYEKLNDRSAAMEHYQAAEKLGSPEKWAGEAQKAIARLQH